MDAEGGGDHDRVVRVDATTGENLNPAVSPAANLLEPQEGGVNRLTKHPAVRQDTLDPVLCKPINRAALVFIRNCVEGHVADNIHSRTGLD